MQIESFNVRETMCPRSELAKVELKKYEVKSKLDEDGISQSYLVEKNDSEFLDVPFRDYSMQTMVATGEVNRLQFVSPISTDKLDMLDRINVDADEISARLDHMEVMQQLAAESSSNNVQSSDVKSE